LAKRSPIEGIATIRRIAITVIVEAFVGLLGFLFSAPRPAIALIKCPEQAASLLSPSPKETFSPRPDIVSHATPDRAGNHSPVDRGNTPFGTIYGSNITPDPRPGVGVWSLAAFTRAMREGVSRDGSHLFAAFPYTELSDDDVQPLGDESQQPTWPNSRQKRR
jgi:hypothetical protein